jgi:hypothetical protein
MQNSDLPPENSASMNLSPLIDRRSGVGLGAVPKRYTEEQKIAVPDQVGMVTDVRKWQRRLGVNVRSSQHITARIYQRPHHD